MALGGGRRRREEAEPVAGPRATRISASRRWPAANTSSSPADGITLADSHSPVLLFETTVPTRFYLPEADLASDVQTPSDARSYCPYKGVADPFWSVSDQPDLRDVVWSYARPYPAVGGIAGRGAFTTSSSTSPCTEYGSTDRTRLRSGEQRPGTD